MCQIFHTQKHAHKKVGYIPFQRQDTSQTAKTQVTGTFLRTRLTTAARTIIKPATASASAFDKSAFDRLFDSQLSTVSFSTVDTSCHYTTTRQQLMSAGEKKPKINGLLLYHEERKEGRKTNPFQCHSSSSSSSASKPKPKAKTGVCTA